MVAPGMMAPIFTARGFPTVAASAADGLAQSSPFDVDIPHGSAGNLLLVVGNRGGSNSQTLTWPTGWHVLYETPLSGANAIAFAAYKLLQAGDPELSFGVIAVSSDLTSSQSTATIAATVTANYLNQAPEVSAGGDGTDGSVDAPFAPPLTAGWGSDLNLWIDVAHWTVPGDTPGDVRGTPIGSTTFNTANHNVSNGMACCLVYQGLQTATYNLSGWAFTKDPMGHARTVVVRPVAPN